MIYNKHELLLKPKNWTRNNNNTKNNTKKNNNRHIHTCMFGCMFLGSNNNKNVSDRNCVESGTRLLHVAHEKHGIYMFDTAEMYPIPQNKNTV